jgi:maleylacetoacetate isomerase
MNFRLFHYWRSTSSWRIRWVLTEKNIPCEFIHVDLLKNEQKTTEHLKRNPLGMVPAFEVNKEGKSQFMIESLAVCEWLDESYPEPALLPKESLERERVRELCQIIGCSTQPLQNYGVLKVLSEDSQERKSWASHWIQNGLGAYEKLCQKQAGEYSYKDNFSLADICLIPQVYNAQRFEVNLSPYPKIQEIVERVKGLESYKKSRPEAFKPE